MNTLIVFSSLHGCSKRCSYFLSDLLEGHVDIINLMEKYSIDFSKYSNIIIGGSIHSGYVNPGINFFCEKFEKEIVERNLAVFLCFLDTNEKGNYYIKKSFSEKILNSILLKGFFGGEIDYNKLSFLEKEYIKKATGICSSVSKINTNKIIDFSKRMNKIITAN